MSGIKKNFTDNAKPVYHIIDSLSGLKEAAAALKKEKTIAVDLEADSMYHFKEKVCLVQMASTTLNLLIDPLSIMDLSPLKPLFSDTKIKKIFHGADYDLGIRETSLNAVVQSRFGVVLDKKYQKKDWSIRPLPKEMTDYAVQDVMYLIPLAKILEKELKKKKRLDWVKEECHGLSKVRHVLISNKPLFLSFKGAGRLDLCSLCVLEAILQFRSKIAKKKDRPLFRVFGNEAVMKMTKKKPTSLASLKKSDALSEKQMKMYGDTLLKTINDALKKKDRQLPVYPRQKTSPLSPGTHERVKALKSWRDKRAKELKLDPAILFNKATLTVIAKKNPFFKKDLQAIRDIKSWRTVFFGKEILSVLRELKN
ncbi:MAG: HRDC domain-containing protein [Deltaproteobacteria bacterium]|nr:HRDC domain-containing protein [Deltaproteobacteria bacterium]